MAADATLDAAAEPRMVAIYGATAIVILESIEFPSGALQVPADAVATLDAVAEILKKHRFLVEIEGYADPSEKLPSLALRRAKRVQKLLIQRGVNSELIVPVDRGAVAKPDGGGLNARVRFHVVRELGRDE